MLQITCPHCKRTLRIDEDHVGRTARCRFCSETFVIKRPSLWARVNRVLAKCVTPAAIVTALAALRSFSMPVAVVYWVSMTLWMVLKRSKRLVPMAGAAILGPVTLGLGLVVWTMVGLEFTADADPHGPRWLAPEQAFFLCARDLLTTAKSLSLFLFVLAVAAVVHNFWPRTEALKRVLTLKGHVGRAWLAVAVVTTFAFVTGTVGTAEAGRLEKLVNQRYRVALRDRDAAEQRVETSAAVVAELSSTLEPEDAAVYYALYKLGSDLAASYPDTVHVWVRTSVPLHERLATRVTDESVERLSRGEGAGSGSDAGPHGPHGGSPRPPAPLSPLKGATEWKARDQAASSLQRDAQRLDAIAAQNEAAAKKVLVEAAGKTFSHALNDAPFGDFISAFLKKTLDLYAGRVPPGTVFDIPRRFARFLMSREVTRAAFANNLERHLLADARAQAGRGQWSTALERLDMVQRLEDAGARRAAAELYPEYLYRRAVQMQGSGNLLAARDEYRRVIERHGSTRWAADSRSRLTEVEAGLIAREVEVTQKGPHVPLDTPEPLAPSGRRSRAVIGVQNATRYSLTVLFSGPTSRRVELVPGQTETVWLATGSYGVAASASDPRVDRYAGASTFRDSVYGYRFVIETRFVPREGFPR